MSDYRAPVKDAFRHGRTGRFKELSAIPGYEEATPDLADAVLDEVGQIRRRKGWRRLIASATRKAATDRERRDHAGRLERGLQAVLRCRLERHFLASSISAARVKKTTHG